MIAYDWASFLAGAGWGVVAGVVLAVGGALVVLSKISSE